MKDLRDLNDLTIRRNDHLTDLDLTGCGAEPALSKVVPPLLGR